MIARLLLNLNIELLGLSQKGIITGAEGERGATGIIRREQESFIQRIGNIRQRTQNRGGHSDH